MTSLLLETHLEHVQREYVESIRTSGEALVSLLNSVLDFSKIESHMLDLESIEFDVRQCIEGNCYY